MSKYDNQLSRMSYLMGYEIPRNSLNESKTNGVEFHKEGADGNVYGIVREGRQYVIKKTVKGKENLKESYDYLNGYMRKKENSFNSYNTATKHLESLLMNINESYGVHEDVSVVDFNRNEKALNTLTEEARKELNRMHQIFENSTVIGAGVYKGEDSESKGKATDPKAQGDPFSSAAKYEVNGAAGNHSEPKTANSGYDTVSDEKANSELTGADKFPGKANGDSGKIKDYKETKSDLDGNGTADQGKKNAHKVVKINESLDEIDDNLIDNSDNFESEGDIDGDFDFNSFDDGMDGEFNDFEDGDIDGFDVVDDEDEEGLVGQDEGDLTDDELTLESIIREFEEIIDSNKTKDKIVGPDKVMDGETNGNPNKSLSMKEGPTHSPIHEECEDGCCDGDCNVMKNYKYANVKMPKKGNVTVWNHMDNDTLDEARIERLTDMVMESLLSENDELPAPPESVDFDPDNSKTVNGSGKKAPSNLKPHDEESSLFEAINRIVAEEVTRLNLWGQHPRYGKQPMTLPDNREVLAGTADRDFNDDSAKGSERYGKKIGKGAPFDQVVKLVTDSVMSALNEGAKKKYSKKRY